MRNKREPKLQIVPAGGFEAGTETPHAEEPAKVLLPAVYYAERDGGDRPPLDYPQICEMREQSGGQLGVEKGERLQDGSRQQRIDAEFKGHTERLNRIWYLQ